MLFAPVFVGNSQVVLSPHPLTFLFPVFVIFMIRLFVMNQLKYWVPLLFLMGLFFQLEVAFAAFVVLQQRGRHLHQHAAGHLREGH